MTATMTREEMLFLRGLEAPAKPSSRFTEAEIVAAAKKNQARMDREWAAHDRRTDKCWDARRRVLQSALLRAHPHLKVQLPCGLIEASTGAEGKADTARRVKANAARVKREWAAGCRRDNGWLCRRTDLEDALLLAHPHLADQEHCKLISSFEVVD